MALRCACQDPGQRGSGKHTASHSISGHADLASTRRQGRILDRLLACSATYFRVVIPKAAEEPAECQRKAEGDLEMRAVRKPLEQPSEKEKRRTQLKPHEETGKNNNKQNIYVF